MQKTARLKKIARHLLATTCLTVAAAGAAHATTFNESSLGGGDFSNSLAGANVLPVGTDVVNGAINGSIESADFFQFTGLTGGTLFSLTATTPTFFFPSLSIYDSANVLLLGPGTFSSGSPATISNYVTPADGILRIGILGNEGTGSYTISLDAAGAPTPEPSTLVGVGLGLAGALAMRRRNRKA